MRTYGLRFLAVLLLTSVLAAGCASLCAVEMRGKSGSIMVAFSDQDRMLIKDYYAKGVKYKKTPPGLAKKSQLPPGLQKRVEAGQPLPPGLQGRGLPCDLEKQLSVLPAGYSRLKVGRDIVIKSNINGLIVDAIFDVD